jgi:hypothetical protein
MAALSGHPERRPKVNEQHGRFARIRYTATGAVAALAVAGAIAGTAALAARPHAKSRGHAAVANGPAAKTPAIGVPDKTKAPPPPVDHQPFLDAIQQLVDNGAITAAEAQVVDREIVAGRVDTGTLASSGFTAAQLQAVQQALGNAKQALAPAVPRPSK